MCAIPDVEAKKFKLLPDIIQECKQQLDLPDEIMYGLKTSSGVILSQKKDLVDKLKICELNENTFRKQLDEMIIICVMSDEARNTVDLIKKV